MKINDLSQDEVNILRSEIILNSLFTNDYKNSFGIEPKEVQNFFDGFVDYCYEMWKAEGKGEFDLGEWDTTINLMNYVQGCL